MTMDFGQMSPITTTNPRITFDTEPVQKYEFHANLKSAAATEAALLRVERGPVMAETLNALGIEMQNRGDFDRAFDYFTRGLEEDPKHAGIYHNFGFCLAKTGDFKKAISLLRKAVEYAPDNETMQFTLSIAELIQGNLKEGWALYKSRFCRDKTPIFRNRTYKAEKLKVFVPCSDKSLLVIMDQGLGEEIMFSSMWEDICAAWKGPITAECSERLIPILSRSFPAVTFVPRRVNAHPALRESYDYWTTLADIATELRASFLDFPHKQSYLVASDSVQYPDNGRMRVGISWHTQDWSKMGASKSIPIGQWGPILSNKAVDFVSLQYMPEIKDMVAASSAVGNSILIDQDVNPMYDLDQWASQVNQMDLVITTSNTTAHMAGALGVPVWVLVPRGLGQMWHWFIDITESPWYKSAQLIRQVTPGDWGPVIERAAYELKEITG